MDAAHEHAWGRMRTIAGERPDLVGWVRDEVRDRGPVTAADIEQDAATRTEQWGWNWSDVKTVLEWLFWTGEVSTARRNTSFARVYDLTERVLPPDVMATPTPSKADAIRELVRVAATGLGVATEPELRDYFRLPVADTRAAVAELVEEGVLSPVSVSGWRQPAYLHGEAKLPRRVRAATLLSPFDPLIWERSRTERLFDFRYRIEIYTPAAQRVHGYYVLPFLLGESLVARVDLKADRRDGVLRVPGAFAEPGHPPDEVASALAAGLWELARWLGLDDVAPPERGDLARAVRAALFASANSPRTPAPRSPAGVTV
jgi:uncharacterized protein YcaQ